MFFIKKLKYIGLLLVSMSAAEYQKRILDYDSVPDNRPGLIDRSDYADLGIPDEFKIMIDGRIHTISTTYIGKLYSAFVGYLVYCKENNSFILRMYSGKTDFADESDVVPKRMSLYWLLSAMEEASKYLQETCCLQSKIHEHFEHGKRHKVGEQDLIVFANKLQANMIQPTTSIRACWVKKVYGNKVHAEDLIGNQYQFEL